MVSIWAQDIKCDPNLSQDWVWTGSSPLLEAPCIPSLPFSHPGKCYSSNSILDKRDGSPQIVMNTWFMGSPIVLPSDCRLIDIKLYPNPPSTIGLNPTVFLLAKYCQWILFQNVGIKAPPMNFPVLRLDPNYDTLHLIKCLQWGDLIWLKAFDNA